MEQQSHPPTENPYVGPRSFSESQADRDRFFGRQRESDDLRSLVLSEQVVLFYAQSGAGKSSLVNARLRPDLQAAGFRLLPTARVSGALSDTDIASAENVFILNLLIWLDENRQPAPSLYPQRLIDYLIAAGWIAAPASRPEEELEEGEMDLPEPATGSESPAPILLVIDQFEELFTTHADKWAQRTAFFRQLRSVLQTAPYLHLLLVIREDFVASLDPYMRWLPGRLQARYGMERLGPEAAEVAIANPVYKSSHPFAPGVARQLVDNLRLIRVQGQNEPQPGQYVEPVQLQVVCLQLWENLRQRPPGEISADDLQQAGDVDRALADYYEDSLRYVQERLPAVVAEAALRDWFSKRLITENGTRGLVNQGEQQTGGLPNAVVQLLDNERYLVRRESRAGGVWCELTHDRFVEPILTANRAWLVANPNPLTTATQTWLAAGRAAEKLLSGEWLSEVQTYAEQNPQNLSQEEKELLAASLHRQAEKREMARQVALRRRTLITTTLMTISALLLLLFAGMAWWGWRNALEAQLYTNLAQEQLKLLEGEKLLQEARDLKDKGDLLGAEAKFEAASLYPNLKLDLVAEKADLRRQIATKLVQEGEILAANSDFEGRNEKFKTAFELQPPSDTLLYVWIESGEFNMGSIDSDLLAEVNEKPQQNIKLGGYWIMRTEVTNFQYGRCVAVQACAPPNNQRWNSPQFSLQPVTDVTWQQANNYATWVGGHLPTEAEWEKGCRGSDARLYPWGNESPSPERLNYYPSGLVTWTNVGSYPAGANGLFDMAGNVWEWTADWYKNKYDIESSTKDQQSKSGDSTKTIRGGSFLYKDGIRCASRNENVIPNYRFNNIGFRVVSRDS